MKTSALTRRVLAIALAVGLLATGASQRAHAQVVGPIPAGAIKLTLRNGTLCLGAACAPFPENRPPQCSNGIDDDLTYDETADPGHTSPLVPPSDFKIDYPADPGCSSAVDDSELVTGLQPYLDVTLTGTVTAAGAINVPVAGVVFPPAYGYAAGIGGSGAFVDVLTVKTVAAVAATGQINANGSITLNMPLREKIEGGSGLTALGNSCFIGGTTAATAINLQLTTETSAAPPSPPAGWTAMHGTRYDNTSHRFRGVNNNFTVPTASGCGTFGLANGTINSTLGLPIAAGTSSADLQFEITPALPPAISPQLTATPATGATPLSTTLSAAGTTSVKPISAYLFDADGDGIVDVTSATNAIPWTYSSPGTYTASVKVVDSDGDSNTKTTTVTVVNTAPVASPQTVSTLHDTPVGVTLAATDANGDALTYSNTNPSHGTLSGDAPNLTYSPNAGYAGADSFDFTADDGHGGTNTATISIDVTNQAPAADPQSVSTLHDHALAITLSANDADADSFTYAIGSGPSHGTLSGDAPAVTYTPDAGFVGADSFTFNATDGIGTGTATVSVDVTNQAPSADIQTISTLHDHAVNVSLTGADGDGDGVTFTVTGNPSHGTLSGDAPNLTYTPDAGFVGADSVTFEVSDGISSVEGTITLDVTNQAPSADSQTVTTAHDTPVNVTLTATDADGDTLNYAVTSGPTNGTLSGTAPNLTYTPNAGYLGADSFEFTVSDGATTATGTVTIGVDNQPPSADGQSVTTLHDHAAPITLTGTDPNGDTLTYTVTGAASHGTVSGSGANVTYTPDAGYVGSDSFDFTVGDGNGGNASATVSISVTNQAPSADGGTAATPHNHAVSVSLSGADPDGDTLAYSIDSGPSHGTLSGTGANRTYTPDAGFVGADSFSFTVNDGAATASATVTIDVTNEAPVAQPQSVSTLKTVAVPITLGAGDPDGDTLTYSIVSGPSHGTLSGSGANRTYTPTGSYTGPDSFVFKVSDGNATSTATVNIQVVPPTTTVLKATTGVLHLGLFGGLTLEVGSISATLKTDAGVPIAGRSVKFTAGGQTLCVSTTNAQGKAACSGIASSLLTVLSLGYTATFAGDTQYAPSAAAGQVTTVL